MRKLALTAAVAAATLVSAPAADAHPTYHYAGGCYFTVASADESDPPTWIVEGNIVAVSTSPDGVPVVAPIRVVCNLHIDGVDRGIHALAQSPVVASSGPNTRLIVAPRDATFVVCTDVNVGGSLHHDCAEVAATYVG